MHYADERVCLIFNDASDAYSFSVYNSQSVYSYIWIHGDIYIYNISAFDVPLPVVRVVLVGWLRDSIGIGFPHHIICFKINTTT